MGEKVYMSEDEDFIMFVVPNEDGMITKGCKAYVQVQECFLSEDCSTCNLCTEEPTSTYYGEVIEVVDTTVDYINIDIPDIAGDYCAEFIGHEHSWYVGISTGDKVPQGKFDVEVLEYC